MPEPIMFSKKYRLFFILFSSFLGYSSCNNAQENQHKANRLIHESSPYLLQHAYNPVDWYPWGEEAFKRAKKEDKPVIISIGYAACHWCHVMEKESFEDDSIAAFMNANFVNIKVDREERPDVDQIYIEVAQMINGSAGWPLNCIVMPDGKPFFAGTYYPSARWLDLLTQVSTYWTKDKKILRDQAEKITSGIQEGSLFGTSSQYGITPEVVADIAKDWLPMFDRKKGGFDRLPRFPMPVVHNTLLTLFKLYDNKEAFEIADLTLRSMATGGIYDQVGGGFARYSTDANWKVPHFEKMLYDNGQLLSVYSKAFQITQDPLYRRIIEETVVFLEREMRSESGGFYSSLDADSEGEEGRFYVWSKSDLDRLLGTKAGIINDYFQVSERGNWEHGNNILIPNLDKNQLLKRYHLSEDSLHQLVSEAKKLMLAERAKRMRPGLDDKIITSWNALTIIGLADASRALKDERLAKLAIETAVFLSNNLMNEDYRLDRIYKNGKSSINGFLDDYAITIAAFISIYQITFEETWLERAKSLTEHVLQHFGDSSSSYFFYTSDLDPSLIARKIENVDNVIPSANSEMAINLFLLGNYFYEQTYINKSEDMLNGMIDYAKEHTSSFANWFQLYLLRSQDFYEIAIVGDEYATRSIELAQYFVPNAILLGGTEEGALELLKNKYQMGKTMIYVCKQKSCKLPVEDVESALKQLE